ncbi:MAG: hypothetical protein WBP85_09520 [Terracidiphilus sp.]
MRKLLREATIKYGAPFFILFWGVLCFGGLTLLLSVCDSVFANHKPLTSFLTVGIVVEKLFGGLVWGSIMWLLNGFLFRAAKKKDQSSKENPAR